MEECPKFINFFTTSHAEMDANPIGFVIEPADKI